MTWFKVDDGFAFHRKVMEAGNAAIGLWVRAGSWCGANLTQGALPKHMVGTLGAQRRDAMKLVAVGLWCETSEGYQFKDWDHYQPTKQQVEDRKAADRERQKRHRERQRHGVTDGVTPDVTPDVTNASPTRPDPSSNEEDASADAEPREDIESLCAHLQRRLIENGRKNHTAITSGWRNSARLLIDRDKRPVPEIHAVIDWCQGDSFWKSNIGGMPKLREQYDTLLMQATNRGNLRVAASNGERTWTTAELDAILGVDYWRLPPYPAGMDADQGWEWEQRVKREHRAERIRQAQAKMGQSA